MEAESKTRAAADAARRHDDLLAQMLASSDRTEIARILEGNAAIFTVSEAKKVWASLLSLNQVPAPHELVTMAGRGTFVGYFLSRGGLYGQRGSWKEVGTRSDLWFAEKVARVFSRGFEGYSDRWVEGFGGVLDADGSFWRAGEPFFLGLSGGRENSFVLPKGERVLLTQRLMPRRSWCVEGGYSLTGSDDQLSYVRTVAAIAAGTDRRV